MHGTAAQWFALGITLHELVTGRRPFDVSRLQAFRFAQHSDDLALPLHHNHPHHNGNDDGNRNSDDDDVSIDTLSTTCYDLLTKLLRAVVSKSVYTIIFMCTIL